MALAIATSQPAPPPAPRGAQWLDVETAAKRSGLGERRIRQLCVEKWFATGQARQEPGGAWSIRDDADVRLARVRFADDIPADLKGLKDKDRKIVLLRRAVLKAQDDFLASDVCRTLTQSVADQHFLDLLQAGRLSVKWPEHMGKVPSDRTLRNWRAGFKGDGLCGLIDGRGPAKSKTTADDPFYNLVKDLYLVQSKPTLKACFDQACIEARRLGFMTRSLSQTRRWIDEHVPKIVQDKFRGGPSHFNDHAAAHITRDYSTIDSNEIWTADHHQFDVMVWHKGKHIRPWLTAFEDCRSRKIVGWTITAGGGNTDTILDALAMGIDTHGVPREVYVDNGRDFDSRPLNGFSKKERRQKLVIDDERVHGVFVDLDIQVIKCWPYHGQSKPIERFFGTLESQFGKFQSTYCGSKPDNKPENLAAKLQRGTAPELPDFIESFRLWLDSYHAQVHTGDAMDGRSPAQAFDDCLREKRTVDPAVREVLLWKCSPPTKVTRNGVRFEKLSYGGQSVELARLMGKEVIVRRDRTDVGRVGVFLLTGAFVCYVNSNRKLPFKTTPEELREQIAANKRRDKVVNEYHQTHPRSSRDLAAQLAERRIEDARIERESRQPVSPLILPIQTPLNNQLPALQQASSPMKIQPADTTPRAPDTFLEMADRLNQSYQREQDVKADADAAEAARIERMMSVFRGDELEAG